jgi:hypothetical protein
MKFLVDCGGTTGYLLVQVVALQQPPKFPVLHKRLILADGALVFFKTSTENSDSSILPFSR